MNIGFVTCVQLGLSCVEEIYRIGGRLELLVTLEDDQAVSKSGRVWLDGVARDHSVPLVKSKNVNDDRVKAAILAYKIDWLFIIGWSQIAKQGVLGAPRRGVLGMHPTLLPEGRGRAAIPWAILKGLSRTGVTLFQLDEGIDTGPIVGQIEVQIGDQETATSLYARVSEAHCQLIRDYWTPLTMDQLELKQQDHTLATQWPGRTPEDGEISHQMTMQEVDRLVRATTRPYPGAFFARPDGGIMRIWHGNSQITPDETRRHCEIVLVDGYFYADDYTEEAPR